ncbi:MAG: T9SS type A sorting domain-containing protein [Bacteroidales bacterium]|nr:T9SS type A sorting domain-containing protein [Bacteroidales bacterium]
MHWEGADDNAVTLYDITGRLLATRSGEQAPLRFDVSASGAYIIKIGHLAPRKVVVIK